MTNDAKINVSGNTENVENTEANNEIMNDVCYDITEDGTVIIGKPAEGVAQTIEAEAAQKYVFSVSSDSITSAEQDGDNLVVTFDNGSQVTLENYISEITQGSDPSLSFINGQTIALASFENDNSPLEVELEEPQSEIREVSEADSGDDSQGEGDAVAQQLAQTEPAAGEENIAQQLAEIEPAAGDAGGAGAGGNSGFGFNSSFDAQGVIPIQDVGPIAPTQLEYGIPTFQEDVFPEDEEVDELTPLNPTVEADASAIYEDATPGGPSALSIVAAPETGDGVLTVTISNIPNTWTVVGAGTYDPVAETYTITNVAGQPINDTVTLTPPADSDVDLIDLPVNVTETSASTGRSGSASTTVDVIVDVLTVIGVVVVFAVVVCGSWLVIVVGAVAVCVVLVFIAVGLLFVAVLLRICC